MASEAKILSAWQTKLALLSAIIVPTFTVAGAYYGLQLKASERDVKVSQRISDVELRVNQNFADKTTMKELQDDVKALRTDMTEIKTLLKRR